MGWGRDPEKDIMLGFEEGLEKVRFVEMGLVIDLHIERWDYIYTIFGKLEQSSTPHFLTFRPSCIIIIILSITNIPYISLINRLIMGNDLCAGPELPHRRQVTEIPDSIPNSPSFLLFRGQSSRYSDLSVISLDSTSYIFTLKIQHHHELQVTLPVLNEISHRAVYINYKLDIVKQVLVDPCDSGLSNTMIAVKNQLTGVEYSMRLLPFRSYNSLAFKKGLEEVWVHQKKISKKDRNLFLTLQDAFVYGVNPDQQVLVLLFERTNSTLFQIGEYRRQANWQWSLAEQLTLFQQVLESCQHLRDIEIIHRDIRPSNIFFLEHINRFVLGNFSTAREIYEYDQEDLLTVYGLEASSADPLPHLISEKSNMGIYKINDQIYTSLVQILAYIHTLNPLPEPTHFQPKILAEVAARLDQHEHLNSIIATIKRHLKELQVGHVELFDDHLVHKLSERIYIQKYKSTAEERQFKAYQLLGYYKEFSQMAHRIIERNNINDQPFKNAYILKDLGYFYQQNGTGGIQYLLNSCILFCKQVELDLQYRMLDDAEEHITQAEELYLRLSSVSDFSLNLIEIYRLRALLKMHRSRNNPTEMGEAVTLINRTLNLAGDKNLTIEKQMDLFLTWGVVYRQNGKIELAEQRLKNGLSICENTAAFSSPSSAILFKSHFLYQLGIIYFNKMRELHNPQRLMSDQQYNKYDYKGRAESYFKLSLEIRERESSNSFEVIENHLILGSFYLMISNYNQAKMQFKRALVKLQLIKDAISPEILIQLNYDLGSACYKLKQCKDAQTYYRSSIKLLQEGEIDDYWKECIRGNLALCRIRCGEPQGRKELEKVKEIIKFKKGIDHYDYIFLQKHEETIVARAQDCQSVINFETSYFATQKDSFLEEEVQSFRK